MVNMRRNDDWKVRRTVGTYTRIQKCELRRIGIVCFAEILVVCNIPCEPERQFFEQASKLLEENVQTT